MPRGEQPASAVIWHRNGYLVRQGLLSEQEVLAFRQRALELAHQFHGKDINRAIPMDLLSEPVFQSLVLDPRILALASEVIGPRLVYFGDSKVTIRNTRGEFHKDNALRGFWPDGDAYDPFDPADGPYDVLRIFIYLQDHRDFAGNLRVRRGSHRQPVSKYAVWPRDLVFWLTHRLKTFPRPPSGKKINVNTALGDAVVMNLRTTHGANAIRIKGLPQFCLDPTVEKLVPRFLRAPEPPFRIALIITLGAPGVHLDRFIQSRMKRASSESRYRNATFDSPEMLSRAHECGLELRFDLVRRAQEQAREGSGGAGTAPTLGSVYSTRGVG